jgi:DNA-binding protein HU-beta
MTDALGGRASSKQIENTLDALVAVGHRELKEGGITLPGFAKVVAVEKAAQPAREGINPFTNEKQKFAAKPASKGVRARPVKAVRDAVA